MEAHGLRSSDAEDVETDDETPVAAEDSPKAEPTAGEPGVVEDAASEAGDVAADAASEAKEEAKQKAKDDAKKAIKKKLRF